MLCLYLSQICEDSKTKFELLKKVNSELNLFLPGTDLDEYSRMIDQLKVLIQCRRPDLKPLLAHVLLFNADEIIDIEDKEDLDDLRLVNDIMFDLFVRTADASFDKRDLAQLLTKMAIFCTNNIDWQEVFGANESLTCDVIMPFTREEEAWLERQLSLVDAAYRSVPVGEELTSAFMMHSLGVPLPESHMPNIFRVAMERVRKILTVQTEFQELPVATQRRLLMKHAPNGLTLTVARGETRSGIEQVQEGLGFLDEDYWRQNYLPELDSPEKIRKVTARDSYSQDQWRDFTSLVSDIRLIFDHPKFYKLSLLFALTMQDGHPDELSRLHCKYRMLLQRRLRWRQDWVYLLHGDYPDPNKLIVKVLSCFERLKELDQMHQQVLRPAPPQNVAT